MALHSKNPGYWRTARTGRLPAHNNSVNTRNSGMPVSGAADMSAVTIKAGSKNKRFKPAKISKSARKRQARKFGKGR